MQRKEQTTDFISKGSFWLVFLIYRVFFPSQNLLPHRPLSGFNFFRFSKLWIFLYFFHLVFKGFAIYINVKEDFSPGVIEFWDYSVNSYFYVRHSVRSSLHISPKNLQSGPRVVIIVLNTQWYQCLWLTMWFHEKKSKETLETTKSLILLYNIGSRFQKWPKIAKKTDLSIAICSIFIGMVYFEWYLANPHVKAVQEMCGKGGQRVI